MKERQEEHTMSPLCSCYVIERSRILSSPICLKTAVFSTLFLASIYRSLLARSHIHANSHKYGKLVYMLLKRTPVLNATMDILAKKQDGDVATLRQIRLLSLGLLDT